MPDLQRFAVFVVAASVFFISVVLWVVRKRAVKAEQMVYCHVSDRGSSTGNDFRSVLPIFFSTTYRG